GDGAPGGGRLARAARPCARRGRKGLAAADAGELRPAGPHRHRRRAGQPQRLERGSRGPALGRCPPSRPDRGAEPLVGWIKRSAGPTSSRSGLLGLAGARPNLRQRGAAVGGGALEFSVADGRTPAAILAAAADALAEPVEPAAAADVAALARTGIAA